MKRNSTRTVEERLARLEAEGLVDLPFEDRYELTANGKEKNVGEARVRSQLTSLGYNRGIKVRTKVFRLPDDPDGGVIVAAKAEGADAVFAGYAEGFYGIPGGDA